MTKIKAKWIGQVVVEVDGYLETANDEKTERLTLEHAKDAFAEHVLSVLRDDYETAYVFNDLGEKMTVTVTQLHADLYRDEPSEWTKEEAT